MKKTSFIILIVLFSLVLFPMKIQATWLRTYGVPDTAEAASCAFERADGSFMILGCIIIDDEGLHIGDEAWILNVNPSGDTNWTRSYTTDRRFTRGESIIPAADGGYLIVGGAATYVNTFAYVHKINEDGDSLWGRKYDPECPGTPYCAQPTADEGFVITGDILGNGAGETGPSLSKFTSDGNLQWRHLYNDYVGGGGHFHSLVVADDGGFVIAGEDLHVYGNVCLYKVNADGDSLWVKSFPYKGAGQCVKKTPDGGYIVCGYATIEDSGSQVYVVKTDALGDTLWTKTYGSGFESYGLWIDLTSDGGYFITATRDAIPWLIKTDSLGDTLWTRTYGENIDMLVRGIQTSDGGYLVAGGACSFGGYEYPFFDLWLMKLDSEGKVSVSEEPVFESVEIVPSIGRQVTLLYSGLPEGFHANVFDASGRKVDKIHSYSSYGEITWPGSCNQSPGVYFIRCIDGNQTDAKKVVLVR
ncbi:T9SS type A sorting domain-containing protein [candidate division WOR-3 bacterium]|nr:T9SS type A sorting domain-containing protein [candidate division WOR-3 bacterium]